jgi:hypothetical protein
MKRLAILIVIVLLVAGGGGAAWWFLLREPPAETAAEAEAETAAEAEVATAARKRFVNLDPIVLPIIREGQVTLHLTVVLSVELVNLTPKEEIEQMRRPLRDAIFTELHGIFALRYVQEKGFDLPIVRELLLRASRRVLGEDEVRAVLVRNVATQVPQKS